MQDSPDLLRISTSLFNSTTTTPEIEKRNQNLQTTLETTPTFSTVSSSSGNDSETTKQKEEKDEASKATIFFNLLQIQNWSN